MIRQRIARFITMTVYAVAVASVLALAAVARAQTNPPPSRNILSDLAADLGGVTNWIVAPYATYAPDAPTKFGGGILALYNFNNYIGAGPGIDWLGEFNLVSANVSLGVTTHPLSGLLGWTNFTVRPFVGGGLATAISGAGKANGQVSTVEFAGASTHLFTWKKIDFGVGAAYSIWTSAGPYSGKHYQMFIEGRRGF